MKDFSPELVALLATDKFEMCDLYTLTLFDGTVLRYALADLDIRVGENVWNSKGPRLDDSNSSQRGHWKVGLDVDTWQIAIYPRQRDPFTGIQYPDQINGISWLAAAAAGFLDGARVLVQRAYFPAWPQPWTPTLEIEATGVATIFLGEMAEVDIGRSCAYLTINDYRHRLTTQMPRNLYSSGCRFTLFDAGCSISADDFAVAGSVGSDSQGNVINAALEQTAGYFDLGRIVMTSGKNEGFARSIRSWDGTSLKLIAPFWFAPEVGDTFTVYPGCDKSLATCTNTFANAANFGGTPFIPAPEDAI